MPYTSDIHHRRSIRLKEYDYSLEGLYSVMVCCQDMKCRFGKIKNGKMVVNDFGKIAHDEWCKLSERYSNVMLDAFQIMPNHMHGIIAITEPHDGRGVLHTPNNKTVIDKFHCGDGVCPPASSPKGGTHDSSD